MSTYLTFSVYGTPAPQGSKRHVGNGIMIESSKRVKPWRQDVKYAALEAMGGDDPPSGPLWVNVTFYLTRPKSHFRTGKNAHLLRDGAPEYPAHRPDLDKLLRSTLDAMGEAGVWADDAQVVGVWAAKLYAAKDRPPGASVAVVERP